MGYFYTINAFNGRNFLDHEWAVLQITTHFVPKIVSLVEIQENKITSYKSTLYSLRLTFPLYILYMGNQTFCRDRSDPLEKWFKQCIAFLPDTLFKTATFKDCMTIKILIAGFMRPVAGRFKPNSIQGFYSELKCFGAAKVGIELHSLQFFSMILLFLF